MLLAYTGKYFLKTFLLTFSRNCKSKTLRVCMLSHSFVSDSLQSYGLWPARLLCSWNFPGKNPGVGCCFLLQEIFPAQGSNSCPCASCTARGFFIAEALGQPPNLRHMVRRRRASQEKSMEFKSAGVRVIK